MAYPQTSTKPFYRRKGVMAVVCVVIVAALWGIIGRIEANANLNKQTEAAATPVVVVMQAPVGSQNQEIVLPGNVQAWHEAPIFARTNGYLKSWVTDIGAHVKAGDVLAEIETPEIDAQLHQAEADLASAQANNILAQSTAKRWLGLLKTNSVSKQETDEKTGDAAAKAALVAAARANVDRLRQLKDFEKVISPMTGIVTARNTDIGALINAGSGSSQGQELFHVAEVKKLRVYVQVPENYTPAINSELKADLTLTEYPGRTFQATLVQSAHALDPGTRTLLVELSVDNSKGELLPGGYAQVHLKIGGEPNTVRLPVNTLIFRAHGLQVATIGPDNKALLKTITIGRDFGKEVEVSSGISAGETVIINPPDSLVTGEVVKIAPPAPDSEPKDGKKS